ncbi:hypothetical protein M011DRAFT_490186 [Sporormia fimetaria CBS 119925]|uniref:Pal1-domain-containing protein n=1 Tax=Sporormia fimetaria CBS 119925 TaxID=1340428 RepID=A0A6A6V144_9PLEO|nr:hypothetical protein M011DRAFT_490186 [Sporormia fimetaria CBS 119925]
MTATAKPRDNAVVHHGHPTVTTRTKTTKTLPYHEIPAEKRREIRHRVNQEMASLFHRSAHPEGRNPPSYKGIGSFTHVEKPSSLKSPDGISRMPEYEFVPLGFGNKASNERTRPELEEPVKSLYLKVKNALYPAQKAEQRARAGHSPNKALPPSAPSAMSPATTTTNHTNGTWNRPTSFRGPADAYGDVQMGGMHDAPWSPYTPATTPAASRRNSYFPEPETAQRSRGFASPITSADPRRHPFSPPQGLETAQMSRNIGSPATPTVDPRRGGTGFYSPQEPETAQMSIRGTAARAAGRNGVYSPQEPETAQMSIRGAAKRAPGNVYDQSRDPRASGNVYDPSRDPRRRNG